jgi:hypothetical protein
MPDNAAGNSQENIDDSGKAATVELHTAAGDKIYGREDVIDLTVVFAGLWRWKWLVVVSVAIGGFMGGRDLHDFSPQFTATMLVLSVEPSGAGMNSSMQQLSRIAEGFGVGGGGGGSAQTTAFDRLKRTFQSYRLAEILDKKHNLLRVVFKDAWDAERGIWRQPTGRRFEWRQGIRRFFNLPTWRAPDIEQLANYVGSAIVIEELKEGGFKRVSVNHNDPELAVFILRVVFAEATALLRARDFEEIVRKKAYLENRLETASLSEIRSGVLGLLMNEERKSMLLGDELPYAAEVLERGRLLKVKTAPKVVRTIIVPIATGLALSLAFILALVLFQYARNEPRH